MHTLTHFDPNVGAHADTYMKNDVLSIQEGIINHVEYTMARSRYKFDDFEAYQATSLSLRDRLIGGSCSEQDGSMHMRLVLPKKRRHGDILALMQCA
eukprot:365720-Chlamydomonas_euryale.AAC.12